MLRAALLVGTVVLALGGCGGEETQTPQPATSTGAAVDTPSPSDSVLASRSDGTKSDVFWADPLTLEPVDARFATIPFFHGSAELSPDGSLLAVGGSEQGLVQLVDVEGMQALETIDLGRGEFVERLNWVRPDLLLASLGGLASQAAAIDPTTGTVTSAQDLEGTMLLSVPTEDALVFLVGPTEGIGPVHVARYDGTKVDSTKVAEVSAGYEMEEGESEQDIRTTQQIPGLAVSPDGARALVVPAGNRVAEVDLASGDVAYHDLSQPVSLLDRLRNWLEPAAEAKLIEGPGRTAVWLPNGLVAVSGADYSTDGDVIESEPAGLMLIDPADWSVSRVSEMPGWVTFRDGALLGSGWQDGVDRQMLEVFDPDGTLRFGLDRAGTDLSQTSGGHLYAASRNGARYEIIDLATGETVAKAQPRRQTYLLYLD